MYGRLSFMPSLSFALQTMGQMAEESKACFWVLADNIFPGYRNSNHPTEKLIFQQLLPLEAEEREGQLHREICPLYE